MEDRIVPAPKRQPPNSSSHGASLQGGASTTKNNNFASASFEWPFHDNRLEPLPLREQSQLWRSPNQSMTGHFGLSTELLNQQKSLQVNLAHAELAGTAGTGGTDKEHKSGLAVNNNQRGRVILAQHAITKKPPTVGEESVARFRPFQDDKWQASFQKLLQFKHKCGHCCVPHSYKDDPALARWVKRQRHQYKKFKDDDPTSTLTARRLEQLEAVGFVWHSHAAAWMEKLNELKAFRAKKGHCNVPSTYPDNVALSTWVKSQRRQYKLHTSGSPSTMTVLRFRILKSLGFVFEPRLGASKNATLELAVRDQDGGEKI